VRTRRHSDLTYADVVLESSLSTLEGNRELSFEDVLAAATSAQVDVSNGLEFGTCVHVNDVRLP
jgi:hypothetical protein